MYRFLVFTVAIGLVAFMCGDVYAFPGSGDNCAGCHSQQPGPAVETVPALLEIQAGSDDLATFITGVFPDGLGTIKLTGLEDAGLDAVIPAGWTFEGGGLIADFEADGPFLLNLGIGLGAIPDDYTVGVLAVGGGPFDTGWNTKGPDLTIRVTPIPEPATLVLVLSGLGVAGLCVWRRKRLP